MYKGNPVLRNLNRIRTLPANERIVSKKKKKNKSKKKKDKKKKKEIVDHVASVDISHDGHKWFCQKTPCVCHEEDSEAEIVPELPDDFEINCTSDN